MLNNLPSVMGVLAGALQGQGGGKVGGATSRRSSVGDATLFDYFTFQQPQPNFAAAGP